MKLNRRSLFGLAFLVSFLGMLTYFYFQRPKPRPDAASNARSASVIDAAHTFAPGIFVTEQINEGDVSEVHQRGYATLIDLRPDFEAANQVPSATVARSAQANQLAFYYIPVAHGDIPDAAVAALGEALSNSPRPVLLYCRSGRRAARTLSLYEASLPGGPDAAAILNMARSAGQSADDLTAEINRRIAARKPAQGGAR
ncbi:MAG: sulfur transferase domain-containing protein [Acidobacteriota bacterium]|nr:sulfur transferase domain-containing protein [Acidobacteriota bacterium]